MTFEKSFGEIVRWLVVVDVENCGWEPTLVVSVTVFRKYIDLKSLLALVKFKYKLLKEHEIFGYKQILLTLYFFINIDNVINLFNAALQYLLKFVDFTNYYYLVWKKSGKKCV